MTKENNGGIIIKNITCNNCGEIMKWEKYLIEGEKEDMRGYHKYLCHNCGGSIHSNTFYPQMVVVNKETGEEIAVEKFGR